MNCMNRNDGQPFTVAVDFDGTLCLTTDQPFPAIGEVNPGAAATLRYLRASGFKIIIWTCRYGQYLQDALLWCHENHIEYDYANENPNCTYPTSGKIFAHYYIDDRAIGTTKKTFKDQNGTHRVGVDFDVIRMFFSVRMQGATSIDDTVIVLDDGYVG